MGRVLYARTHARPPLSVVYYIICNLLADVMDIMFSISVCACVCVCVVAVGTVIRVENIMCLCIYIYLGIRLLSTYYIIKRSLRFVSMRTQ